MNTDIDTRYEYPEQIAETVCWHCGGNTDPGKSVVKNGRIYCCNGCFGVSNLIHSLGLEEYYNIRDANKHEGDKNLQKQGTEDYSYLNQENFKKVYTSNSNPDRMDFYIEGIHCTGCLWLIENLSEVSEQIKSVELNMSTGIASVSVKNDFSEFPALAEALGYRVHPLKPGEQANNIARSENRRALYRIGVAGFCAGNIMLLAAAVYSGADSIFKEYFQIISAILIIPVISYCAYPFYMNVLNSIKYKKADVDIAVVFIILAGSILSIINLYFGGETYFDSIAAFIFLLLLSRYALRYFQNLLTSKRKGADPLFSEQKVLKWDGAAGQYFLSPVSEINAGDRVKFEKGASIPFDGTCLSRNAYLDVAVLTGENFPRNVQHGEKVYAGSGLESENLKLQVDKTGYETRIGKILKKIDDGSFVNKNLSSFTDRYSTIFTFTVAIIALVFITLGSISLGFSGSLTRTISFVLVSCPCAFIFVLPLTYSFSIKSAFEKGYIISDLGFFEKASKIKNIFFDKTGTLTNGRFRILDWDLELLTDHEIEAIYSIQTHSMHPIAEAIRDRLKNKVKVSTASNDTGVIQGKGFRGRVGDDLYEFLNEPASDINEVNQFLLTRVNVIKNGKKISEILFGDTLREEAKLTVECVKSEGIEAHIVSGDRGINVLNTASKLGINTHNCFSEKSPEEKIRIIEGTEGSIMVGDGLNDSGALASADIGIATQGSVEQNLGASDVYLIDKSLLKIPELLDHGKATSLIINKTVIASLIYNITAGAFALTGYISPLAAAVMMPLSSFFLMSISYLGQRKLKRGVSC